LVTGIIVSSRKSAQHTFMKSCISRTLPLLASLPVERGPSVYALLAQDIIQEIVLPLRRPQTLAFKAFTSCSKLNLGCQHNALRGYMKRASTHSALCSSPRSCQLQTIFICVFEGFGSGKDLGGLMRNNGYPAVRTFHMSGTITYALTSCHASSCEHKA
jgi:hypothetical protein